MSGTVFNVGDFRRRSVTISESYSSATPERLQLASFGLLFHQPKVTILHKLLFFSLSYRAFADYAKAPC